MKNKIKKFAAMFLTLAMMVMILPGQMLTSYAASGKITFSDPTVTVGNQVSVTMKIATSDGAALGASDVRLQYDSSALEFVSGTNANGGAGSVRVIGAMEAQDQTTFSFTLKFKALKAGNSSITVTSQEVYDADSQMVTIDHVGSSAVKITAPETYSKEASLASLTISPGELTPSFSSDVTAYNAVVGGDVEKITVSAPAKDSKASVSVSGNEGLQIGENTITCKVTAEDGQTTKTYTILVTKTEEIIEETPGESTEEQQETGSAGSAQNILDGNWQVAETFDETLLPEGFTVTEFVYDGMTVQAGTDAVGNILLYMTNENGEGDFFIYDAESNILAPYVTVRMAEKTIIVLPPEEMPEGTILPENFAECTIDIGSHTVSGWIWNDGTGNAPEYCVVYGQNENGERSLYRYDQKEMTLQRYFQDPEGEELRAKYEAVANDYNSLLDDYKVRGWIIVGLFAAVILLVIILIVMLLTRKPKGYDEPEEIREFVPTERRKAAKARAKYEKDEDLEFVDLDDEEPAAPMRERAVTERPAALKTAPKAAPVPEKEKPVAASVKKMEEIPAVKEDEDDDFEFIDLDL